MKISAQKNYAVLTGDVVDSSKMPKAQRQTLPALLSRASKETQRVFPDVMPLEVDVFRGDSWQFLVSEPRQSLRVGLYFRACLRSQAERGRGLDTRVVIGVGKIDFVRDRVSQGDGEAYRLSGRGLEAIAKRQRLQFVFPEGKEPEGMSAIVRLVDALVQGWTGKQARAVQGALRGWTQEKISDEWPGGATQPAIAKHLESAQWPAVEEALHYVENNLQRL